MNNPLWYSRERCLQCYDAEPCADINMDPRIHAPPLARGRALWNPQRKGSVPCSGASRAPRQVHATQIRGTFVAFNRGEENLRAILFAIIWELVIEKITSRSTGDNIDEGGRGLSCTGLHRRCLRHHITHCTEE